MFQEHLLSYIVSVEHIYSPNAGIVPFQVVRRGEKTYQNVGTDLSNVLGQTITVEIIILDLEILSKRNQNRQGELVCLFIGDSSLHRSALRHLSL